MKTTFKELPEGCEFSVQMRKLDDSAIDNIKQRWWLAPSTPVDTVEPAQANNKHWPQPPDGTCKTCRWWHLSAGYDPAIAPTPRHCRKHAPVLLEGAGAAVFPRTAPDCGCGDWEWGAPSRQEQVQP